VTRRAALFRQTDLARAIRTAKAEGMPLAGVRISPEGEIFVAFVNAEPKPATSFDEWKASRDARKA
jgi:hypothetical protein